MTPALRFVLAAVVVAVAMSSADAGPFRRSRGRSSSSSSAVPAGVDNSTAQGVAEACARMGRLQHFGGWRGHEGLGMASTREGAYRSCCFANSGMPDADVGYAQTSGGSWVCCRRYGR